jgi:hypothetical protein
MLPLLNRREWFHVGALGVGGLTLPQLLHAEVRSGQYKSCVFIFAWGGPAQHETFDPKPDAPAEVRGAFAPIRTSVPGLFVGEHLPKLAQRAHRYAIIRSATHSNRVHNPGAAYALTGRKPSADIVEFPARRTDWPSVGSLLSKYAPVRAAVPPYVVLPIFANDVNIPTPGQHAGFLGGGYDPLIIHADPNQPQFRVAALAPQADVSAQRLADRRQLLAQLEPTAPHAGAKELGKHYERAYDLVTSAATRRAFDLNQEPAAVRERYGRTRHGQSVLLARRLVEAGVRLVLVNDAEDSGQNKRWDTHSGGFNTLKKVLPETDAAVSSLLDELHDRGLLDSTLVVWMGEFGRSPKADAAGGRDHWPDCYSLLLAGGGIRGGAVYGASDSRAAYPKELPVRPEDIHATIYHALGIPADAHLHDTEGRPLSVYTGQPIRALFG